jgi:hypothetical protein
MACVSVLLRAQQQQPEPRWSSHPEAIEWTWGVRPEHPDPKLPNVLLEGDSISRNYFPEVTKELQGVANVYLLATSASAGDPRLGRQIEDYVALERVHFAVVHFNNGLHGWSYTEEQYRQGFGVYLAAIRAIDPDAKLIWASSTPMKTPIPEGGTNNRVQARNAIALSMIKQAGIPVDDQHLLMTSHQDAYQDNVHFNEAGSALQGQQAAKLIRSLLP